MKRVEVEFFVFKGDVFEVEFYYNESFEIIIWNDFINLSSKDQASFFVRVEKLAESASGIIHPKTIFNLESNKEKIWAIKFGKNRFCSFFYKGGKIIITNAYKKQSQKNGKKEKEQIKKAAKFKADYEIRVKNKDYYIESED